ncbi:PEP-CTERM sorting domain-containing protein [Verrucomicrobiota bacterium]
MENPAAAPEPATIALLGAGVVGLLHAARCVANAAGLIFSHLCGWNCAERGVSPLFFCPSVVWCLWRFVVGGRRRFCFGRSNEGICFFRLLCAWCYDCISASSCLGCVALYFFVRGVVQYAILTI